MKQFLQFSVVGVLGFLVDTAILYAVLAFGDYYYSGRVVSFLGAVTFTWYMNPAFRPIALYTAISFLRAWATSAGVTSGSPAKLGGICSAIGS